MGTSSHAGNLLSSKATNKLNVIVLAYNLGIQESGVAGLKFETSLPRLHNVVLSQKEKLQVQLWSST